MHFILLAAALVSLGPVQADNPNRQPQLAASKDMTALVFGNQGSIWFSKSLDGAKSFSTPIKVGSGAGLALGRHRGPRIVFSGSTIVVSAVVGNRLPAGDLLAWRSTDAGLTWKGPSVVDDVPGASREGLHAMTVAPDGTIAAAWLDLRAAGTRLYGAYSRDAGATWSKNVVLYEAVGGTICQCCHPSLAVDDDGKFLIMFRNVAGGSRDMYLAKWDIQTQQITKPQKLGQGSWGLNACPMDGGGIGVSSREVTTAWRRQESIYLEHPGSAETEIGKGKDAALVTTRRGAYVAWTGSDGVELLRPNTQEPTLLGREGGFSALVSLPQGGVAAAWEHAGRIELAVID